VPYSILCMTYLHDSINVLVLVEEIQYKWALFLQLM
jgi:hypothetical protein